MFSQDRLQKPGQLIHRNADRLPDRKWLMKTDENPQTRKQAQFEIDGIEPFPWYAPNRTKSVVKLSADDVNIGLGVLERAGTHTSKTPA